MSHIVTMTLEIDIEVLLDDDETDTSWVLEEVGAREQEMILGGYRFTISRIQEAVSSATETENPVLPTVLCEEDPEVENFCAYHHVWHAGREGDLV